MDRSHSHVCLYSSAHRHCFGHTSSTHETPAAMPRLLFFAVLATCWFIASPPTSVLRVDRLPAPTCTTTSPTSARGSADRSALAPLRTPGGSFPDPVPARPWGSEHAPPPRTPRGEMSRGATRASCRVSDIGVGPLRPRGVFSSSSGATTKHPCPSARRHLPRRRHQASPSEPACLPRARHRRRPPSPRLPSASSRCRLHVSPLPTSARLRDSSECVGPSPQRAASAAPSVQDRSQGPRECSSCQRWP